MRLRTWFRGGFGRIGMRVCLDLRGLFQPICFCDSFVKQPCGKREWNPWPLDDLNANLFWFLGKFVFGFFALLSFNSSIFMLLHREIFKREGVMVWGIFWTVREYLLRRHELFCHSLQERLLSTQIWMQWFQIYVCFFHLDNQYCSDDLVTSQW